MTSWSSWIVRRRTRLRVPDPFERVVVEVGEAPSRAASAAGRRRVRDMLAMGSAVARSGIDLLYFPASYSFFPVWNVPRVVVTMHDTLALAHPDLVFPTWQGRVAWKLKEHAAVRRSDRIVTVSEAARRDLLAWFRLPEDRVRVVTEGPATVFRPLEDGPRSDAVLEQLRPGTRLALPALCRGSEPAQEPPPPDRSVLDGRPGRRQAGPGR